MYGRFTKEKKELLTNHMVAIALEVQARLAGLTHALSARGASGGVAH